MFARYKLNIMTLAKSLVTSPHDAKVNGDDDADAVVRETPISRIVMLCPTSSVQHLHASQPHADFDNAATGKEKD